MGGEWRGWRRVGDGVGVLGGGGVEICGGEVFLEGGEGGVGVCGGCGEGGCGDIWVSALSRGLVGGYGDSLSG